MDRKLMDAGLEARRAVLGDEYVDRAMKNADTFNQPFQELVSEYCWGVVLRLRLQWRVRWEMPSGRCLNIYICMRAGFGTGLIGASDAPDVPAQPLINKSLIFA